MRYKEYKVLGVMSGTSLDGIDLAYVKIREDSGYTAAILTAETIAYDAHWKKSLQTAHAVLQSSLDDLNQKYTDLLAGVILDFMRRHQLEEKVDIICSHGHTILHQPAQGVTLQIGNLPKLARLVNKKLVCDFRVQDVALGGQGAPLVPIGDQLLFNDYAFCLNLGGFANVSTHKNDNRLAYDICAVNTVLNRYAEKLGSMYDEGGAFAKAGKVNPSLLQKLNALPFYKKKAPKSLGIEWVHAQVLPLIELFELSPRDVLASFTEHVAIQLATEFTDGSKVLVTGGGAFNTYLMQRLQEKSKAHFVIPEKKLVEYKEALIFALLGVLKLEEKVNTLASVTGAKRDHSAGEIYLP